MIHKMSLLLKLVLVVEYWPFCAMKQNKTKKKSHKITDLFVIKESQSFIITQSLKQQKFRHTKIRYILNMTFFHMKNNLFFFFKGLVSLLYNYLLSDKTILLIIEP